MEANKVVISLSGGLDSTMLLMEMLSQGKQVKAYAFDYGQKHKVELEKLQKNIKFLKHEKNLPVDLQIINLQDCFSDSASSLCTDEEIPQGHYQEESMKSTVVENRNVIFSSIIYGKALGWANKTQENVLITLGIHAGDHTIYPDTTPESQSMARELFRISNWGSERVDYIAPFKDIDKSEVLMRGVEAMEALQFEGEEIMYVIANTHSCYSPDKNGKSCGKCGTCVERKEAFEKVGLLDSALYVE